MVERPGSPRSCSLVFKWREEKGFISGINVAIEEVEVESAFVSEVSVTSALGEGTSG